jgi:hypothetical protein
MRWLERMDLQLVAPLLAVACLGLGAAMAEVRSRIR